MKEDTYTYVDYQEIVRQARIERSIALGDAIAAGVRGISHAFTRLWDAIAHHGKAGAHHGAPIAP